MFGQQIASFIEIVLHVGVAAGLLPSVEKDGNSGGAVKGLCL